MSKVRGITVEVSADASKFNAQIKALSKETKATQSELNALQKGLELKFDAGRFKQAQQVAQKALDETAQKTDALRARMANLEKAGAIDTDEYAALQRELNKAESEAVKLNAQIEKLNKMPLDNLTKKIDGISSGFTKAGQATRGLSMAATGTLGALAGLGLSARNAGDEIGTAAVQAGMTAEQLQKMRYVALQTDVDTEKMSKGFVKARAALADLATGTVNTASTALQKLNIDFSKFSSTDEAFYGIIEALGNMDNELEMTSLANEIFGDRLANEMIPIIKSGGDAISEYAAEYETLGGLSNEQVEKLGAFDNVLNKIQTQLKNATLQIGTALLPVMEKLATFVSEKIIPKLEKMAEWFGRLTTKQMEFGLKALAAVAMISPLLSTLGKVTGVISGIVKLLGKGGGLTQALDALAAHPIIAIIAVIAMLVALLYTTSEEFREAINRLVGTIGGLLAPILDVIIGVLGQLMSLLAPILAIVGDLLGNALNILLNALTPVFDMLQMLFGLLGPLLNVALIPLQIALTMLQVPLQLLGQLLNWIMPIFNAFAKVVEGVFNFVINIINTVLGWVENAINWVIDKINWLIRGINNLGGWLGVHIDEIQNVSLKIDTAKGSTYSGDTTVDTSGAPSADDAKMPNDWYDGIDANYGGDTNNYEYDNSTHNTTQNVTVTVENYAAEVDVDKMVAEINRKLAEAM